MLSLSPARLALLVRREPELPTLAALVLGALVVPPLLTGKPVSLGVLALGVPQGALLALYAIGMVLVYRTNRIINFAQAALGLVGGLVFLGLFTQRVLLRLAGLVCQCLPDDPAFASLGWQVFGYAGSALLAVALGPGLGWLVYVLVIRRFRHASRLVLTVATVGLTSLMASGTFMLYRLVFRNPPDNGVVIPVDVVLSVRGTQLHLPDLLAVVAAAVVSVGLAVFLRRTPTGVALRAAADDESRAETLGIDANAVGARVWALSAGLSSLATVISLAGTGDAPVATQADTLVRLLTVMVLARLTGVVMAVVAAIGLGVTERALAAQTESDAVLQGLLLVVIAVVLLVQRRARRRADTDPDSLWRGAVEARPIPAELARVPVVRRTVRLGWGLLALLLLGYPWVTDAARTQLATGALILGLVALSLLVLTGWAGQISLGQLAFSAVGAYLTTLLVARAGVPLPLSLVAAGMVGALVAVVVGIPALRLPGLNLAVATLALALATSALLVNREFLGGALPTTLERPGLFGLDLEDDRVFYYLVLVVVAVTTTSVVSVRRSRTARALIAARDNEHAAQLFGISVVAARLRAFALAGFLAAFAGGLLALQQHGVQAPAYEADASLRLFLLTVIGGLGSVAGPLLALGTDQLVALIGVPALSQLWVGAGVLLLLIWAPAGLSGLAYGMRDALLRRVAIRYRISVPSLLADAREDGARRAAIAPLQHRGGSTAFVPVEYRLPDQWSLPHVLRRRREERRQAAEGAGR